MLKQSSEVIYESTDDNGLVPQPSGRSLCHNRIAYRSHSNHIAQVAYDKQDTNSNLGLLALKEAKGPDDDVADEEERKPKNVESRSSNMREKEPAEDTTDDVASGKRDVEVERLDFGETSCLEEDDGVGDQGVAAEDLSGPDDTVLKSNKVNNFKSGRTAAISESSSMVY